MQIGDASRGIACWLYTNKKHGDQCVQFVQGLMPLDHWTEQPLGVLADAPGGDVERVATSAEIAQVRQSAINEGLEMAAEERAAIVAWLRDPHTTLTVMGLWITKTKRGEMTSRAKGDIGTAGWFARDAAKAIENGEHLKVEK